MSIPQDLLDRALALDDGERAELAQRLIQSLSTEPEEEREPGYEEAWAEEIEKRVRAFEADPSVAIPMDEAMRSIRKNLGVRP